MYQHNYKGRRWYYKDGRWYASVTEFVKNSLPTPIHLQQWYKDNTAEQIDTILKESSEHGTHVHELVETMMRTGSVDLSNENDKVALQVSAIAQFIFDYSVDPIEVEYRVAFNADSRFSVNFAGTADVLATTKKGLSIIDWKTGNIHDSHKYQMMCYALAYQQANPDQKIDSLINVRPKEWRGSKPTYEVKIWDVTEADWETLSAMSKIYKQEDPPILRRFGTISMGQEPSWQDLDPNILATENEEVF